MSEREKILDSFLKMLTDVIPNVLAVYLFEKELALFDKFLKGKEGLVIILSEEDYSLENLLMIDLIYDKIQDEFGWEEGVKFASSFSRSYIRTEQNLWYINIQNNHCLLPEDMVNLRNTGIRLYGCDFLEKSPFPHKEEEIFNISVGLSKEEVEQIAQTHPSFYPMIDPHMCWTRFDFAVDHSINNIIKDSLVQFKEFIKPEKHIHIYGRYGGSGKTQILYSLMQYCKLLHLAFIYRSEFWKDEFGKYKNIETNSENEPRTVSKWVIENTVIPHFVLFLDEIEIDLNYLFEKIKEKFPDKDPMIFIISASKEICDFVNDDFNIYDIITKYSFTEFQFREILVKLLEKSNIEENVFPIESVNIIVKKARLWNHSSIRRTPTAVILAATLSLIESIKIAEENSTDILVAPEIAEKWSLLATSPWYQKYAETHDVHSEYMIFDGKEYTEIDPHYSHSLP